MPLDPAWRSFIRIPAITFFTDQGAFDAAVAAAGKVLKGIEDFEEPDDGILAVTCDPLDENCNDGIFSPGEILYNVAFQSNFSDPGMTPGIGTGIIFISGGMIGNANDLVGANTFAESTDIMSFNPNHTAMTMMVWDGIGGPFIDVRVFDKNNALMGQTSVSSTNPAGTFVGVVVVGNTIGRINLSAPGGSGELLLEMAAYIGAEGECGDGTCDPGETCESCPEDCGPCPFCGDGVVNGSEECDPPDDSACPGECQPDCNCPSVGCKDYEVLAPGDWKGSTCGMGDDCDLHPTEEVVYTVTLPNEGLWTFTLCTEQETFDTWMAVGDDCCNDFYGWNDDSDCGLQSTVTAVVPAGEVWVIIEGYSGCGDYHLTVSKQDDGGCKDHEVLAPGWFDGGNTCGAGNDCDLETSEDEVWTVTLPNAGLWTFSVCDKAGWDTRMYLGSVCCAGDLGYDDDACNYPPGESAITADLPAGEVWVTIEGFSGACGSYSLDISKAGEEGKPIVIEIMTDAYPSETTWVLEHKQSGTVVATGGPLIDPNTLHTWVIDVTDDPNCYNFTIFDAYGDGICCAYGDGYYNVYHEGVLACSGGEFGDSETCSVGDECPCEKSVTIDIFTDNYPSETTWELIDKGSGGVVASGGPLTDPLTQYTWTVCIAMTGCYNFVIYDLYGDGICCLYGDGHYEVYHDGVLVCSGGEFLDSEICEEIGWECAPPAIACCVDGVCQMLTEEECAAANKGIPHVNATCDDVGFTCAAGCVYDNGPVGTAPSPGTQYAVDYPFVAAVADDFILNDQGDNPCAISEVVAWFVFWNHDPLGTPADFLALWVTVYENADPKGPDGNPSPDGNNIGHSGNMAYNERIPAGAFQYEEDPPGSGDWRVNVPVGMSLEKKTKYWLELIPEMSFGDGGQVAWKATDLTYLHHAVQGFPLLGMPYWEVLDVGVAFQLIGSKGGSCCTKDVPGGSCVWVDDPEECVVGDQVQFYPGQTCAEINCEEHTGACCDGDTGLCMDDVPESQCQGGQLEWTKGTLCIDVGCVEHTGACCDGDDGICRDFLHDWECTGDQEAWFKDTLCADIECLEHTGACCNGDDGICRDFEYDGNCTGDQEEWFKYTLCADIECVEHTGACCDGDDGTCRDDVHDWECTGAQEEWFKDTPCSAIECLEHTGACCNGDDGICRDYEYDGNCTGDQEEWFKDTLCSAIECVEHTGACCDREWGTCTDDVHDWECTGDQEDWYKNTACSSVDCIRHDGACCDHATGTCRDGTYPEDCVGDQERWHKYVDCAAVDCFLHAGACCYQAAGVCLDGVFEADCKGDWYKGTPEEPTQCSEVECEKADIPTITEWGLLVLSLLLLTGIAIKFGVRRTETPSA